MYQAIPGASRAKTDISKGRGVSKPICDSGLQSTDMNN